MDDKFYNKLLSDLLELKNEIEEIYKAIANKEKNYRLKYNVKIKKRGLIDIEIDDCK